jgi:hypothetical protein
VQTYLKNANSRALYSWQVLAIISLSIAITSFLSPQLSQLGRGLWTTLPALSVAWFSINQVSPYAFSRSFKRFRNVFLLGIAFITQAGLRFAYADDWENLFQRFCFDPLIVLVFLLYFGALKELGETTFQKFRCWTLFIWSTSLAVGLPVLIENPGVARLTMGNIYAIENAAQWAPYGIGEYSVYTSLAICIGPLFFTAKYIKKRGFQLLAILLVSLAGLSVLFSTFAMASTLMALSVLSTLILWVTVTGSTASHLRKIIAILLAVGLMPLLYYQVTQYEQTTDVVSKAERIYGGISTSGLAKGDDTGRGEWFVTEMWAFVDEPFFGYIPDVTGQTGYGHSSLSNSLVLFGFFGALLWFATIFKIFSECYRSTTDSNDRLVLCVSWVCFLAAGILNPIWHSSSTLGALIAFTLAPKSKTANQNSKL